MALRLSLKISWGKLRKTTPERNIHTTYLCYGLVFIRHPQVLGSPRHPTFCNLQPNIKHSVITWHGQTSMSKPEMRLANGINQVIMSIYNMTPAISVYSGSNKAHNTRNSNKNNNMESLVRHKEQRQDESLLAQMTTKRDHVGGQQIVQV